MRVREIVIAMLALASASSMAGAQTYEQVADKTIGYVKAGTFGKPSVVKKTTKLAIGQVRVHYKTVTSSSIAANRSNASDVTVYLDSPITDIDLQDLTNEFYGILQTKLGNLGIEMAPWDVVKNSEYYAEKLKAQEKQKGVDFDGKLGQAWVSVNAFDGPVLFKWRPEGAPEIVGYGQFKKLSKTAETAGGALMTVDVVLDFASIALSADIRQDRQGWFYGDPYVHSEYSIAGMMNVPKSYIYMINGDNGFDMYQSLQPVAERRGYAEKPREDASKAAYSTQKYFPGERHSFTPLVIPAGREQYLRAARNILETYAEILAAKFAVIRSGGKPAGENVAQKPIDNTSLKQVVDQAKKNNDTTAVTTGEITAAAQEAMKQGKFQLAADYYGKLIELDPADFQNYMFRGVIFMNELKDYKAAVKDFDQVIKLNPTEPVGYFNRGSSYLQLTEWKKAKKDFDQILALKPDYVNAYLNRGIVYLNMKDLNAALADFNKGIELAPGLRNLYQARSIAYKMQGNAAAAAADELRAAQMR